jgi:hypothetical protein
VRYLLEVTVRPADYVQQGHRPRTEATIERVFEFAEAAATPFTVSECWKSVHGSYGCVRATLASMRQNGLVTRVNPGNMPPLYIRSDHGLALPPP